MTIDTQTIENPTNDYNYMAPQGRYDLRDHFPLTLLESYKFFKDSTEFNNAWKPIIVGRENNFVNHLDTWKTKHSIIISNQGNVFVFGEYQTINWKISGLEIKPLSLPYYITSKNTTRASNNSESLNILEKLFVGPNALFQYEKNYSQPFNSYFIAMRFNPNVYDDFIAKDVTVQTIYDYVTNKTNEVGEKSSFIKDTDKVKWITSGGMDWLNSVISSGKNYFCNATYNLDWKLVINVNVFTLSLTKFSSCFFSFGRSDTDVWPTI